MKRMGLEQQFHGESGATQQTGSGQVGDKDEVILEVVSGHVSFVVPSDVSDDQVLQDNLIERYINCVLRLENGAELALWINEGAHGVDLRLSPKPTRGEKQPA